MLVIAGPSGVGKGTLIDKLKAEFPDSFGFSVSHTTRPPREGEQEGVHYHFTDRESFQEDVDCGLFIEYAEVHGNLYGTTTEAVQCVSDESKICILDIDVQGCRAVRDMQIPAVNVFIEPPSMEALEERLRSRGSEEEDRIQLRMEGAKAEMEAKEEEGLFQHVIMNDDVEQAFEALKTAIRGEEGVQEVLDRSSADKSPARPLTAGGKPVVVFVLGGPGAGKGTQCGNLVRDFGWVHLSAGDLLREEQATDSADSQLIKDFIKDGKIVPVEITIRLLLKAMEKSETKKFLIDGFPRSLNNRDGWDQQVGDQAQVAFCLNFECTEEELEKRLLKRGETSGRADDNIESIKKRFVAFQEQTKPVLDYFKDQGLLRSVQAAQPMEDVWAETKALFIGLHPPPEE